jgi:hypothetical protein
MVRDCESPFKPAYRRSRCITAFAHMSLHLSNTHMAAHVFMRSRSQVSLPFPPVPPQASARDRVGDNALSRMCSATPTISKTTTQTTAPLPVHFKHSSSFQAGSCYTAANRLCDSVHRAGQLLITIGFSSRVPHKTPDIAVFRFGISAMDCRMSPRARIRPLVG